VDEGRTWRVLRRAAGLGMLCLAATTAAPAVTSPLTVPRDSTQAVSRSVEEVIERARGYVIEYGAEMALVIGVERYHQSVANADTSLMAVARSEPPWTRETVSEFALVRVKDDWLGYRDVFQVDRKPVGDRQDRLQQLFQQSPATAVEQARVIADESARYNAGPLQRNFNVPTVALFFLHPSNAGRFRFERAGTDTVDGTPAWKVRYRETQEPTIVRTSDGKSLPVRGMLWIDPAQGRVLKTSMEIATQVELSGGGSAMPESLGPKPLDRETAADRRVETYSRVTTSYKLDARFRLLLPAEMVEEYQGLSVNRATGRDQLTKVNCRATYSDFKKFETSGRLVVK